MGRFSRYLGKFDITIGEEKLELDVKMKDVKKFLTMTSGKGMDEKGVERMTGTFLDIMIRSYPQEPTEEMESFIARNFMSFMNELFIAMGWMDKKDVDAQKKKLIGQISPEHNENN